MKYKTYFEKCNFLTLVILVVLLSACGSTGSDDPQVPPDSNIEIVTADRTWDINVETDVDGNPVCNYDPDIYIDEPVVVLVTDSQDRALGNVDITFSLALSGNTFSGLQVVSLYDDRNGNGVPDHPEELVSDINDPLFDTETDERDGAKFVIIRMNLSCTYRAILTVFGAGLAASATYEVQAQ